MSPATHENGLRGTAAADGPVVCRGNAVDRGTVLAFDFGLRRIGVAVGNGETRHAHALTTIDAADNARRFAAIAALIETWHPVRLVVGLPLSMDGTEHEMTSRCRRFANQLHGRFVLPVEMLDERLTSCDADGTLRGLGMDARRRKARVDAVAAQLILQNHFDAHSRS